MRQGGHGVRRVLGAVTIGQSPRVDLVPEMAEWLGSDVEIREAGALDDLRPDEIAALAPAEGDYVLVSRLRDGRCARMAEHRILPLVQQKIEQLYREGADVVVLLCTGQFPAFQTPGLLVLPEPLVYSVTGALAKGCRLGVLCPDPQQVRQDTQAWQPFCRETVVRAASPYLPGDELTSAAQELRSAQVDLIVMNCMGYTQEMQRRVRAIAGVPVLLARRLVARVLAELLH